MSEFLDNQKVHELHRQCGKLRGQMNTLIGNEDVPDDKGLLGQLRAMLDEHGERLDLIQGELQKMMELQRENRWKLGALIAGVTLISTFAGTVLIKLFLG